jgi:hypothetical protein
MKQACVGSIRLVEHVMKQACVGSIRLVEHVMKQACVSRNELVESRRILRMQEVVPLLGMDVSYNPVVEFSDYWCAGVASKQVVGN